MVIFDVVTLFTLVRIREAASLLGQHFEADILWLFRYILTSTRLGFAG
jgi:hypothetical protein